MYWYTALLWYQHAIVFKLLVVKFFILTMLFVFLLPLMLVNIDYHYSCTLLCAVCTTVGYLMSYWNYSFFPEACADARLDDPATYDTMVHIVGSSFGIALAFKAVADKYGWTHIVALSDDDISSTCWVTIRPFDEVFGNKENYTFAWLRLGSQPADVQLDDILQQIRSRTRGLFTIFIAIGSAILIWPFFPSLRPLSVSLPMVVCRID